MITDLERKNYKWWKDKKILGLMLLILSLSLFLFSFMEVPIATTIHKYTIGLMLGWYHPMVYVYLIFVANTMIFSRQFKFPKWLKLTNVSYWLFCISFVFVSAQTGYFQTKGNWSEFGTKSFHFVSDWWKEFTSSGNAWIPKSTNGGFVGAFLHSFFAMITTGVGAFLISVISLITSISLLFTGTFIGLYKQIIWKRNLNFIKNTKETKKAKLFTGEPLIKESLEAFKEKPITIPQNKLKNISISDKTSKNKVNKNEQILNKKSEESNRVKEQQRKKFLKEKTQEIKPVNDPFPFEDPFK